jgi:SAM-dependent methyltransferase
MAIDYIEAAFLLSAKRRNIPLGRVLMLGRQHLCLSADKIANLERQFEVDLQSFVTKEGEEQFAEPFLDYLGASTVSSMDISDYEESTLCHDLNKPIPDKWKGHYDCVIDGGTLEHVFNFPCAIRNVMELVASGGHFFGSNPANNWLGHGFYQFGPELFFRVFTGENGFEVIDFLLAEDGPGGAIHKVSDPAITGHRISIRSRRRVASLVLARKVAVVDGLFTQTPQQSDYTTRWQVGTAEDEAIPAGRAGLKSLIKQVLPAGVVRRVQERAIEKRHAAEGALGLTRLGSMKELGQR